MSTKLEKIGVEREKARRKWEEWEARYKELDKKYCEQENVEICAVTHSYNLTPDQLAELLRMVKDTMPETPAAREITESFQEEENQYGY